MATSLQTLTAPSSPRRDFTLGGVDLPNGLRVPYAAQGSPEGIPVVMLHGLSDSLRSFEFLLPGLPHTLRAFALTLRGHAGAGMPASGYAPDDFAGDVASFMDAMGIQAAVIVGHSLGSMIAQRFAIDYPDRTLGLVLLGGVRAMRDVPGIDEMQAAIMSLTDPVDPGFVREFQLGTITQPVPTGFVDAVIEDSLRLPAFVWQAIVEGFVSDTTFQRIDEIRAPTLLIWGDQDQIGPREEQDLLTATIPNARLVVYPGTGHAVQWEQPVRVAEDLTTFVAGLTT